MLTVCHGTQLCYRKRTQEKFNELIIDTEAAIRQLEPNIQNTYRHLAAKQIKQILNSNRHNAHHKRQQYSINQIKKILESNNLKHL
jgi:tRNA U34 5-carboxymethylaminomethyl modifying GTPase MnmE/TrmE